MQRTNSNWAPWVSLAGAMLSGCYLSHQRIDGEPLDGSVRDASVRDGSARDASMRDASTPRDAARPDGVFWQLEPQSARVSFRNELGCAAMAGGSLAVTVAYTLRNDCQHAGPVDVERTADGTYVVHANLWVEHHPDPSVCTGPAFDEERRLILDAVEGETLVVDGLSGSEARILVGPSSGAPCTRAGDVDAPCGRDCDCTAGLRCIPGLGDAVACVGGHCGQPCDLERNTLPAVYDTDIACPSHMACSDSGALASPICRARSGGCGAEPCNDGLVCEPIDIVTRCDWNLRLSAMSRHACTGEADCDPGLHCVEHGDGMRRCEVPCLMNTMACPYMHSCQGASTGWVCEWDGE